MDLGTVVDRRPDLRWRGAGPMPIARLPSRRGGAICDSGATVAFMTTTANVDDQPSHPQAKFLGPGSCNGDTPKVNSYDINAKLIDVWPPSKTCASSPQR